MTYRTTSQISAPTAHRNRLADSAICKKRIFNFGGSVMAAGITIFAWERVSQLLFRVTMADIGAAIAVAGITLACAFAIAMIMGFVTTRGQPAHILRS